MNKTYYAIAKVFGDTVYYWNGENGDEVYEDEIEYAMMFENIASALEASINDGEYVVEVKTDKEGNVESVELATISQ